MGCALCRPSSKLHFEDTEDLNRAIESSSSYELFEDMPNLWMTPAALAEIRIAIAKPNTIHAAAYEKIQVSAKYVFADSFPKPYCGKDIDIFIRDASATLNSILYLSVVGAISSSEAHLSIGKQVLLSWAMTLPPPGTMLIDESHPCVSLSRTGITLSRFIDRIIESYRILSASMTNTEIFFVKRWLIALGVTIKASHEFWLKMYQLAGPQYILSWHIFGIILSYRLLIHSMLCV